MSLGKKKGLLSEDQVWSLWAGSTYSKPIASRLAIRPLRERYRLLAAWHEGSLRAELTEHWAHFDGEIDQFLRAAPRRGSVVWGEASLMDARDEVSQDFIHEAARGRIDSLLLDGLLVVQQAQKLIDSEDYEHVRRALPIAYRYLSVSRSERRALERSGKKSRAGRKGAEKRWESAKEVSQLVQSLSRLSDELGDPVSPKGLWPLLYSELENAGLNPRECSESDVTGHSIVTSCYEYDTGKIKYKTFRKAISRARRSI